MKLRLLRNDLNLIFRFLQRKRRNRKLPVHYDLRHFIVKISVFRILQPEKLRRENRDPVMISLYHRIRVRNQLIHCYSSVPRSCSIHHIIDTAINQ